MTLLVDTSVWSSALRRDVLSDVPEVRVLHQALDGGDTVVTTGLILQELLQGVLPERTRTEVAARFASLGLVMPTRADHVAAAALRNACRSHGVQLGTVDALIAQLCIVHGLTLLSTDRDFESIAQVVDLDCWEPS